jgi:hypothetical protein
METIGCLLVLIACTASIQENYRFVTLPFTRQCYHKSLKQHVSVAKSPTQTITTQTNHFFAALCGFIKLERLKMRTKLNHFALKSKLYLNALRSSFSTLRTLTPVQGSRVR